MTRTPIRALALTLAIALLSCTTSSEPTAANTSAALHEEDAGPDASSGSSGPTPISSCAELQAMENDLDGDYLLTQDIDCAGFDAGDGKGFRPVGTDGAEFTGSLDGREHLITNLRIDRGGDNRVGLFGRARAATIQLVGLVNPSITGRDDVGGLIGWQRWGIVKQVFVRGGSVSGRQRVGGLLGHMHHSIADNAYAQTDLVCSKWDNKHNGGNGHWNRHCGLFAGTATHGTLEDTYAAVNGAHHYGHVGGSAPRTYHASFFDCDVNGGCGSPHAEGRPTATMQSQPFFEGEGWDFLGVWAFAAPNTIRVFAVGARVWFVRSLRCQLRRGR